MYPRLLHEVKYLKQNLQEGLFCAVGNQVNASTVITWDGTRETITIEVTVCDGQYVERTNAEKINHQK